MFFLLAVSSGPILHLFYMPRQGGGRGGEGGKRVLSATESMADCKRGAGEQWLIDAELFIKVRPPSIQTAHVKCKST